jgi:hypothetical protein
LAKQLSSTSGAGLSIKIGFAAISAINSTKPSVGINPTFKVSDAKASPAKVYMKSNSFAKAASSAKVSSFINKSGADEPLFFFKVESSTELPILLRQNALEPATRQLPIIYIPARLLATAPAALEYILKPVEFNTDISIDFNNLDS